MATMVVVIAMFTSIINKPKGNRTMDKLKKLMRSKAKAKKALDALPVSPEQIAFDAAEKALNKFLKPLKKKAREDANRTMVGETTGKVTNDEDGVEYDYLTKVIAVIPTRTVITITPAQLIHSVMPVTLAGIAISIDIIT